MNLLSALCHLSGAREPTAAAPCPLTPTELSIVPTPFRCPLSQSSGGDGYFPLPIFLPLKIPPLTCVLDMVHLALRTRLLGGGDLALWHLPLLSRNRALPSSCSVALQRCCDLKFWTLFEVDLLSVPFALLAASIDCSHCCYHSRHVCRRPARYLLSLLITYRLSLACCSCFSLTSFPPLTFDKLIIFTSLPITLSPDLLGLLITYLLS